MNTTKQQRLRSRISRKQARSKVTKTTVGNINVSGITFNLRGTSDSGRDIDIPAVTDENGVAIFSEIPIGTYTIYEDEENSTNCISCR
ncbi:MAG: prealbumin-like fold domain-containing protein [Ruminococcus sp.]